MKKLLTLALVCLAYAISFGQNVPQGIAYQAVAVKDGAYSVAGQNPQAIYWSNKEIKVRFTIFDKYPNGSSQYSEVHTTTTDEYGVFNLIIGQGSGLSGDFTTIPWELGEAHLRVEIDFDDSYTITSFERFWSVPYAFVSKKVKGTNIDSAIQALNDKIIYLKDRDKDTVIGNEGITYKTIDSLNQVLQNKIDALRANDLDTVVGNEIQTLAIKGDSLSISDGNTVKINFPANLDNDSTNEIQTILLTNDTIHLSKGGGKIALEELNKYVLKSQDSMKFVPTGRAIGFDSTANWICPQSTNRIIIELWGAGGKNGNRKYCTGYCNNSSNSEANGGTGGKGGYLRDTIFVTPGKIYKITIGDSKLSSNKTYFDTYFAEGGGNGKDATCSGGSSGKCASRGSNGANGSVIGYDYTSLIIPSYIPSGYAGFQLPGCCAEPNQRGFAVIIF